METTDKRVTILRERALALGAHGAAVIAGADIVTDPSFRDACKQNACGTYGKCWTCPPDVGEIDGLIEKVHAYPYALFFQTVGQLEDSFDFEGMRDCAKKHTALTLSIKKEAGALGLSDVLVLGSGGCGVCETCAKRVGEPCRHPDLALSSLEAYGIFVSKTAAKAGLSYINGKDTVTYFGAVLIRL